MSFTDRIRALVKSGDPDGTVTLRWLQQQLDREAPTESASADEPLADLTVAEVAQLLDRAASTIRGWLHSGELNGYRLNGREWRVTREAIRAFQDEQRAAGRTAARTDAGQLAPEDKGDTSTWRRHYADKRKRGT